ncbi:MAG TPA: DUF1549 domain-containing protein, partial [Armatimonadota bacterium]|nr:DUF1549 domain-containing protein [Armatimonadota bacterium]
MLRGAALRPTTPPQPDRTQDIWTMHRIRRSPNPTPALRAASLPSKLPKIRAAHWVPVAALIAVSTLVGLAAAAPAPPQAEASARGIEFFESRIRPLLVQRCYACHSSKGGKAQGGLALDTRAGLLQGGASGPAIIPGDPEKSPLIKAVRFAGGAIQMPPAGKLPDREIAALVEWVKMGAPDPREGDATPVARKSVPVEEGRKRWAFLPLSRAVPPKVTGAGWIRTPADRFILAELEKKALKPNPYADRRTLIRRAYFDLIGLPPTPEEVHAFVDDRSPDAWSNVVDRLLASPHYGERWGRHWLDLARFAESHGFEHDYDRPTAYPYRDFVIKALNADMPYDRFVQWQIAGDELAPEDPLALAATGFLAAGVHSTQITKNLVEKERYDELDDMASTIGTSMLGLTVGCARCHDHKFDPIPVKDYYRLVSTFTTTVRSEMDVSLDPKGYAEAKARFDREHAPLAEAVARYEKEQLPARLAEWLKSPVNRDAPVLWRTLNLAGRKSEGGATFTDLGDDSLLVSGKIADHDTYTFVAETDLSAITGIRLEALQHPSLVR